LAFEEMITWRVLLLIENCKKRSARNALPNMKPFAKKKRRQEKRLKRNERRLRNLPRSKQRLKQRKIKRKIRRRKDQSEEDPRNADLAPIPPHRLRRPALAAERRKEDDPGDLDHTPRLVEAATAVIRREAARTLRILTLRILPTALARTVPPDLGAEVVRERIVVTERGHSVLEVDRIPVEIAGTRAEESVPSARDRRLALIAKRAERKPVRIASERRKRTIKGTRAKKKKKFARAV